MNSVFKGTLNAGIWWFYRGMWEYSMQGRRRRSPFLSDLKTPQTFLRVQNSCNILSGISKVQYFNISEPENLDPSRYRFVVGGPLAFLALGSNLCFFIARHPYYGHLDCSPHWVFSTKPCISSFCSRKDSQCVTILIEPESGHLQPLSLTKCRLVDLIDVTLACEVANSKLVEAVTDADVDDEDRAGDSLLQIWTLRFGHKSKLLFRRWAQGLVKLLDLKYGNIWSWSLVSILLLMFCKGYEVEFWSRFWS